MQQLDAIRIGVKLEAGPVIPQPKRRLQIDTNTVHTRGQIPGRESAVGIRDHLSGQRSPQDFHGQLRQWLQHLGIGEAALRAELDQLAENP